MSEPDTSKQENNSRGNKSTVAQAFVTSEESYTVLRSLLPATWIIREHRPDFHIDYLIEPTESRELTGINVGVQLKGSAARNRRPAKPSYALKTKHLLYYLEKCELPVFLVLIDTNNRQGHWVFTQEFGSKLDREMLRKQKRILIRCSPHDSLADIPRFAQSVRDAVKYMRELRPSSIAAAVQHKKMEVEAKEPRADVQINWINGQENIIINAKEELPLTVGFNTNNPKTIENIKDFLEKGQDLLIGGDEIEFKGTPLFEELQAQKDQKIRIQYRREAEGHGVFTWGDTDPEASVYVAGKMRIGEKFLTFEAELASSPFKLTATIPRTIACSPEPFSVGFEFHPRVWQNQYLLLLPHFESVYRLFGSVFGGKEVLLRLYFQGNLLGASQVSDVEVSSLRGVLNFLETLKKARMLAMRFKINPVVPLITKNLEQDLIEIDELYSVLFSKEHRIALQRAKVTVTTQRPPSTEGMDDTLRCSSVIQQMCDYKIFGHRVQVGPLRIEVTELRLVSQTPAAEPGCINLVFEGTEKSERVLRYEDPSVSKTAAM